MASETDSKKVKEECLSGEGVHGVAPDGRRPLVRGMVSSLRTP